MRNAAPLAALLLLGACASYQPHAPVSDVQYNALGHDPFWLLSIGDDRIVLTLGDEGGRADGGVITVAYPRSLPRTVNGVRHWQSGDSTGTISVEARPGTCQGAGDRTYEHHVRVRLSGRELTGCGGREIGEKAA